MCGKYQAMVNVVSLASRSLHLGNSLEKETHKATGLDVLERCEQAIHSYQVIIYSLSLINI